MYEKASIYDKTIHTRWGKYTYELERRVIQKASRMYPEKKSCIELGCGDGRWLKMLSYEGWKNLIATEITKSYLDDLVHKIPNLTCVHTKMEDRSIPCENESQNLILTIEVEPIVHSEWFYREAQRALTPNGLIVGVLTNKLSLRALLYKTAQKIMNDRWFQMLSYNKSYHYWKNVILRNGFQIIYREGFCWFPFPRRSNSMLVPFFVNLEKLIGLRRLIHFSPWIIFIAQKKAI